MVLLRRSFVWRPLLVLTITFAIMASLALGMVESRPASGWWGAAASAGMILNEMAGFDKGLGGYGAMGGEIV